MWHTRHPPRRGSGSSRRMSGDLQRALVRHGSSNRGIRGRVRSPRGCATAPGGRSPSLAAEGGRWALGGSARREVGDACKSRDLPPLTSWRSSLVRWSSEGRCRGAEEGHPGGTDGWWRPEEQSLVCLVQMHSPSGEDKFFLSNLYCGQ